MQPQQVEQYPDSVKFHIIPVTNFESAAKKRVRVWPFVLSSPTSSNNVTFTPLVDGSPTQATVFSVGTERETFRHFFTSDVFGVDYSGTLSSSNPFEITKVLPPEVVQILPIAKKFDQIGPEEFFRFGKIIQIELRILPDGGTSIPYVIYFNDAKKLAGTISVIDGVDGSYFIKPPKGVSGNILRVELGPTTFDFHRYYMRFQVARSGRDTELEWIQI